MPERRRASRTIVGIVGGAVVLSGAALGLRYARIGGSRGGPHPASSGGAPVREESALAELGEALRGGDARALVVLQKRVAPSEDAPRAALTDGETGDWLSVLSGLRTGFVSFPGPARAGAVTLANRILDRLTAEPAPARWIEALQPIRDLLSASLADPDPAARVAALNEASRLWGWLPGRSLTPAEENSLADWKDKLYPTVARCLGHRDAPTLVAAVACLGAIPFEGAASAAIPYLENPWAAVRKQTMISFARRTALLTDDLLLKRLHDEDFEIRETAGLILKTRGLTQEQISLGRLIFSPKPQQRVSVIPLLKDRTDLDPIVWLVQLSHDPEELVRISAVEALANHPTPAVRRRLAEMARSDQSAAVRTTAGRHIPPADQTTASPPTPPRIDPPQSEGQLNGMDRPRPGRVGASPGAIAEWRPPSHRQSKRWNHRRVFTAQGRPGRLEWKARASRTGPGQARSGSCWSSAQISGDAATRGPSR